MLPAIRQILTESIEVKKAILSDEHLLGMLESLTQLFTNTFMQEGKVLLCGNGGSAADAQHLAAEFSGRFFLDRRPLFAEALHVNTSYLTAVANDYGYDQVFARMVEAMGKPGDVLWGFSTSGNSSNVVKAFEKAGTIGMKTVAFTGKHGGLMAGLADFHFPVPSTNTPRIQESHITAGHIICELVERTLFGSDN